MLTVPVTVKYNIQDDDHRLDVYDAGVALSGISRSLAISIHYFVNESVIKQAPALSGARLHLLPPRPGSFVFQIDVEILAMTICGMAVSGIIGNACWDFLKHLYARTIGKEYSPHNEIANTLATRNQGAVDAIIDTIENDVALMHRPIIHNATNVVVFSGDNNIVNLDRSSYEYVKAKNISEKSSVFTGNVSSFNANTGRGRIFLLKFGRTISFSPALDAFTDEQKSLLAWSLNEYVNGNGGLLKIEANHISTPNGLLKSLIVHDIKEF